MQLKTIPIEKINRALYNPRKDLKPGDSEYEKLRRSIEEFGSVEPLVWNRRTGNLVGGHQRLKVLQAMGRDSVEAVVVDLPLEREKALNIALNKISGDWDEPKLGELLQELCEIPDLDVEITGFEGEEIENLLDGLLDDDSEPGDDDVFDPEAALDESRPAITQPGDLIELGPV